MKVIKFQQYSVILMLTIGILINGCSQNKAHDQVSSGKLEEKNTKYKVTFVELGSVRCIPCRQMQPIMKSVEEKYGDQVKVVFYDVWTPEGKPYAAKYGIQAIPTQVFLDENGKEFFRHEGFFPEEELVNILKAKGVN